MSIRRRHLKLLGRSPVSLAREADCRNIARLSRYFGAIRDFAWRARRLLSLMPGALRSAQNKLISSMRDLFNHERCRFSTRDAPISLRKYRRSTTKCAVHGAVVDNIFHIILMIYSNCAALLCSMVVIKRLQAAGTGNRLAAEARQRD